MPCYEVQTMSVEFTAQHRDLLDKAIGALKWNVVVESAGRLVLQNGMIVLDLNNNTAQVTNGWQRQLNELKRAYSQQCIDRVARLNAWTKRTEKQQSALKGTFVKF